MKLKRVFSVVLTSLLILSFFSVTPAEAEALPQNNSESISVYTTGKFSLDVPGHTLVKASGSFSLEYGESVKVKAIYSPASANVDFGVIAPNGLFYKLNATGGSFDGSIVVSQRGDYTLAVRNNFSATISVSGYVTY